MEIKWSAHANNAVVSDKTNNLTGTRSIMQIKSADSGPMAAAWAEKEIIYAPGSLAYDTYGIGKVTYTSKGGACFGQFNESMIKRISKNFAKFFAGKEAPYNIMWYDLNGNQIANLLEDGKEVFKNYILKCCKLLR